MPSFVYVLGCRAKDRTLTYVGWTTDVDRRLLQHNSGIGARTTRGRAWVLLHMERLRTRRRDKRFAIDENDNDLCSNSMTSLPR